jgi:hypothetical protein
MQNGSLGGDQAKVASPELLAYNVLDRLCCLALGVVTAVFALAVRSFMAWMDPVAVSLAVLAVVANATAYQLAWRRQRPSRFAIAFHPDPRLFLGAQRRSDIAIATYAAISVVTLITVGSGHALFLGAIEKTIDAHAPAMFLPFASMCFSLAWLTSRRGRTLAHRQQA